MAEIEVLQAREYTVVKGNELIQRSRFDLSLPEQKTIAYICSLIKPVSVLPKNQTVPYQLEYQFNIRQYCKICGIDYDNGKNYADFKAILKKLRDRSMWLTMEDGSEVLVGWLAKVTTNKKSGIVEVKLDEDLVPYLFDLGQRFTKYQLKNILGMKSQFSVRFYEIAKSYEFKQAITFDLDDLKRQLMVDDVPSYANFKDFRKKVLEPAEREINDLTDISISFQPIKRGRKVVQIQLSIQKKEIFEAWKAELKTNQVLDKGEYE